MSHLKNRVQELETVNDFEEKYFPDTQTPSNYDSTLKAHGSLKLQPDKSMESGREICHLTTTRDAVNIWWLVGEGEPGFCLFVCFNVSVGKLTILQSSNSMTMGVTQMQLNEERRRKSCNLKVGGEGVGGLRGWWKEEWRGVDVHRILYVILRELISIILKERRDKYVWIRKKSQNTTVWQNSIQKPLKEFTKAHRVVVLNLCGSQPLQQTCLWKYLPYGSLR